MRHQIYVTPDDERPLLEFIRGTGGRIIHMASPVWPPVPMTLPPRASGADECLAIWYPDVIGEAELQHPDCHPERGPHGCYDAWELPLVTFQRQWYWKRQATILAVELDFRAFRPNRMESEEFTDAEIHDFQLRLARLVAHGFKIRDWCLRRLRDGYIGEGAWRESEVLRQAVEHSQMKRST